MTLLTDSALSLARKIRSRETTSREVIEAHIKRISALHVTLNALVVDRFSAARAEADAADRALADGGVELGPLHGVPISVKECVGLEGMPQTVGMVSRIGQVAPRDATAVSRLRAAGAIPLGLTNVPELAMWMETSNRVYGRTNNPYDPRRIVGGSSGGEGALIGSGGSPLGIGSDIGGSIRMPAFFNGIFGHKPSAGLVPNTGHWPQSHGAAKRYLTTGPMCRRAEDLWPALTLMAGPDGEDDACGPISLGDPKDVSLAGLTVYDVTSSGLFHIDDELQAAQRAVADHLASLGARIIPFSHAGFRSAFHIWSALMTTAAKTSFSEILGEGTEIPLLRSLYDLARGRSAHTLPALALVLAERVMPIFPGETRAVDLARELKTDLDLILDDHAVLLYPSYPDQAPLHDHPLRSPLKWQYAAIWNVLELPVTQAPLGLSQRGLPLGLQLVAGHGRDRICVAVATELERKFGGWVPPPDSLSER